ncbi:MAG: hypothetical protein U0Q19_10040 [Kineosporiaceae bacterium]
MSVMYRAMWTDAGAHVERAQTLFRDWVLNKSAGTIDLLPGETISGTCPDVPFGRPVPDHATTYPAEADIRIVERGARVSSPPDSLFPPDDGQVLRASLTESRPDGSRWVTTLRAWETNTGTTHLWVDVEGVAHNSLAALVVKSPILVRDLLASGTEPVRGRVPLQIMPLEFTGEDGAESLAELLTDPTRDVPVVVFSPLRDSAEQLGLYDVSVGDAAVRGSAWNAGIACVAVLSADAVAGFRAAMTQEFAVWDGAYRVYWPGVDPASSRWSWRHRWMLPDRYLSRRSLAAQQIARLVAPFAATRRAHDSYVWAKRRLDNVADADSAELLQLLELADVEHEVIAKQLQALQAEQEERYGSLLVDYEELQQERTQLHQRLHHAENLLRSHGLDREYWEAVGTLVPTPEDLPVEAVSCSQAAQFAVDHLSDVLTLPPAACKDLETLDGAPEARAWGQTAWQGFLALHAYAGALSEGDPGTFYTWCQNSGHPLAWRATPKKLAMVESDSVRNSRALWRKRLLPVSREVSANGLIHMESHLKIAEGGGNLAPRIYFYVDSERHHVHIGFFGPHSHMPNSKT